MQDNFDRTQTSLFGYAKFQLITDTSGNNTDAYIVQLNPAFSSIVQQTEAELLTQTIVELTNYAKAFNWLSLLELLLQKNTGEILDAELKSLSGQSMHVELIPQEDNMFVCLINLISEQEHKHLNTEFLAYLSHEMKTPLNAILGFTEVLHHKMDQPNHKNMIESILNNGKFLLSLINNLVDLSVMDTTRHELNKLPADILVLVNEIKSLFREKISQKGLSFSVEIAPHFPQLILVDALWIKQIIFHLVENAFKITQKGAVSIQLQFEPEDENKGQLKIVVNAAGKVILMQPHKHDFDVLAQPKAYLNNHQLSIAEVLAKKTGGRIDLKNNAEKGIEFAFILPQAEIGATPSASYTAPLPSNHIHFETNTLLVIDDVPSNILAIEGLLDGMGLEIQSATSGEQALKKLKNLTPKLILLDLRMPGMSGNEVAASVRTQPHLNNVPLIALTASSPSDVDRESLEHFDGYLYKPTSKAELVHLLSKYLPHTPPTSESSAIQATAGEEIFVHPETISKLPEIIALLNEDFLPVYKQINDGMVLFKIQEFGEQLLTFSGSYRLDFLGQYAKTLLEHLENLELKEISTTLNAFPSILKRLQLKIEGQENQ